MKKRRRIIVLVVDLVERIPMDFIFDVLENLVSNCL